jgi:hypothetical protein
MELNESRGMIVVLKKCDVSAVTKNEQSMIVGKVTKIRDTILIETR